MCQCCGQSMDHLLLHYEFAHALWSEVFQMFGIQWVMAERVVSLLFGGWNWLGKHSSKLVLACLMRLIWKEWNCHTFEDVERPFDHLKSLLIQTLSDWSQAWGSTHCISISDFQHSISFSIWCDCNCFRYFVFTIVNMEYFFLSQ